MGDSDTILIHPLAPPPLPNPRASNLSLQLSVDAANALPPSVVALSAPFGNLGGDVVIALLERCPQLSTLAFGALVDAAAVDALIEAGSKGNGLTLAEDFGIDPAVAAELAAAGHSVYPLRSAPVTVGVDWRVAGGLLKKE